MQLSNLQALLARRSTKPLYAVLLLRLEDPTSARNFLRYLSSKITAGDTPEAVGTPIINLCMSWRAVSALTTGHSDLDTAVGRKQLEPFFVDPHQAPDSLALADQLGFVGPSAPNNWWDNFTSGDIDLAIYIGCDTDDERENILADLRSKATRGGFAELPIAAFAGGAVAGYLPAGGRLHFGYRDGITTPEVDWDDTARPGAVNLREFVLGYRTKDYPTAPFAAGAWQDLVQDGSFACFTWIHQDAASFENYLATHAAAMAPAAFAGDPKEWLAAQLVGRWRDGSPLIRHPDVPPPQPDFDDDFGYDQDTDGARCPIGAHIRVVYSRDQPLTFPNKARFPKGPPRLIRRGFSYGPPLQGTTDDGKDRGLFGVFLCARINEQFYSILRWMQQTSFSGVFDRVATGRNGQDNLTGSRLPGGENRTPNTSIVGRSDPSVAIGSLLPFIRYKGVAVLFLPSINAINCLTSDYLAS